MKKVFLSLAGSFFALALTIAPRAQAYDACVDDIYYNIVDDGYYSLQPAVEITYNPQHRAAKQGSYEGTIKIPEFVRFNGTSYLVKGIGEDAFRYSQNITSIEYTRFIAYIGVNAFHGCANVPLFDIYTTNADNTGGNYPVQIPRGCAVADSAFYDSGLEQVYFAGDFMSFTAFQNCKKLKKVYVDQNVPAECFVGCDMLEQVETGTNCQYIGRRAFAGCKSIRNRVSGSTTTFYPWFEASLQGIADNAFEGCTGITDITIPASVVNIGGAAFKGCTALTDITFQGMSDLYGAEFMAENDLVFMQPETTFEGCGALTSAFIGRHLVSSGRVACDPFNGTDLKEIGFYGSCLDIPFNGENYPNLGVVSCMSAIPTTGVSFTESQYQNAELYVPESFESAFISSDVWGKFFKRNTAIGVSKPILLENNGLFYAARYIEDFNEVAVVYNPIGTSYTGDIVIEPFTIGDRTYSPISIAGGAFFNCTGMTSITLPETIYSIGNGAFCNTGLKSIDLSKFDYLNLGQSVFSQSRELVEVKLPDGVNIPTGCFANCVKLSKINFSDGVRFNDGAFYGCVALPEKMDFSNISSATFCGNSFAACNFTEIDLPKSAGFPEGEVTMAPAFFRNPLKKITVHNAMVGTPIFGQTMGYGMNDIDCVVVKGDVTLQIGMRNNNWLTGGVIKQVVLDFSENEYPSARWLDKSWNVEEIVSLQETPSAIGSFTEEQYRTIKVYVPKGSIKTYKEDANWLGFFNINEVEDAGIDDVSAAVSTCQGAEGCIIFRNAGNEAYSIYTIAGQLVSAGRLTDAEPTVNVAPGYYIVKWGENVAKVIVK